MDEAKNGSCESTQEGACTLEGTRSPHAETRSDDGRPAIERLPQSGFNDIRHVVAVMSGKGGVGKSSVTSLLACRLAREGFKVGILDADVTGPSIPRMFGIDQRAEGFEFGLLPVRSKTFGMPVMSINLLLPKEDDPVIWRGPIIANVVKQFWTDVVWGELDFLVIDLPPGTGDAPLTVMQSLPLDGIVVVSSPQDLAIMVVKKAVKMARALSTRILGLVENMCYVTCPHCGARYEVFGAPKGRAVAEATGIPLLAALPLDPRLSELCDKGRVEEYEQEEFDAVARFVAESVDPQESRGADEATT